MVCKVTKHENGVHELARVGYKPIIYQPIVAVGGKRSVDNPMGLGLYFVF